jgi:hypothetical protein
MIGENTVKSMKPWLTRAAGLAIALIASVASAQNAAIDPKATQLLKASTAYVATLKQFSFDSRNSFEVVLTSGQKIQFDARVIATVQRPNRMHAVRVGDLVDQAFYYDGKSVTLADPSQGYYATASAPGTLEAMLDFARESLGLVTPAGDFLYADAYGILTDGITEGLVVGPSMVEGQRCIHVAFRAPQLDLQVWIQEGAQPLPRKVVITSRDVVNSPQFETVVTKWNLNPTISAGLFKFVPPKGAKRIDFLPLAAATAKK